MAAESTEITCSACRTSLPGEAQFCPICGLAAERMHSGTRALETTLHEGDRLAAGKTLLGGVALYEVLLGVRRTERNAVVVEAPPSEAAEDRVTAPEGVAAPVSVRAEVVDFERETARGEVAEVTPAGRPSVEPMPRRQRARTLGERLSEGSMWRWRRLQELVAAQESGQDVPHDMREGASTARASSIRPLAVLVPNSTVRIALFAALIIIGGALSIAFLR